MRGQVLTQRESSKDEMLKSAVLCSAPHTWVRSKGSETVPVGDAMAGGPC